MDEEHNLIGPLNTAYSIKIKNEITPEIHKMAEISRLSTVTIQKLTSVLEMMGTTQITTNDLAAKLNVTERNANRILSNLEQSGYANVVYNKSRNSKGRPVKIYQIALPVKLK